MKTCATCTGSSSHCSPLPAGAVACGLWEQGHVPLALVKPLPPEYIETTDAPQLADGVAASARGVDPGPDTARP